jgi:hypothetical protein
MYFVSSLDVEMLFYVSCDMGHVWSTHVEINFVYSLTWEGFGQHELRCILCLRSHGRSLATTWAWIFCPRSHCWAWLNFVEILFVSSLSNFGVRSKHVEIHFVITLE